MRKKTKSPLKDKPLRNPGQSIDEYIQTSIMEQVNTYLIVIAISIMLAALEWYRFYTSMQPSPWLLTIVAILAVPYPIYRLVQLQTKLLRHRQARDGEKAIGQYLENLREKGYSIFHDIVGSDFNIDHVIISEHGVYTVETKTYSKPSKGEAKITLRDEKLYKNGINLGNSIILQAKAQSQWLKELIKDNLGIEYDVKPIVVFPGWYVDINNSTTGNIWVLNPKGIESFINHQPMRISTKEKKAISYNLSRFVRNS